MHYSKRWGIWFCARDCGRQLGGEHQLWPDLHGGPTETNTTKIKREKRKANALDFNFSCTFLRFRSPSKNHPSSSHGRQGVYPRYVDYDAVWKTTPEELSQQQDFIALSIQEVWVKRDFKFSQVCRPWSIMQLEWLLINFSTAGPQSEVINNGVVGYDGVVTSI